MNEALNSLSQWIGNNYWFAPFIALLAGIIASFMPCCLSSIPLIIGYVSGAEKGNVKKAFRLSLTFAAGQAITFLALGMAAALAGTLMSKFRSQSWFYIVFGIIMVLLALQTLEIFEIIPSSYLTSKNKKKGYLGALITGLLAGLFSTPCSTPVLVAMLALIAEKGNYLWGFLLMLCYSAGHSVLSVIAGTSAGAANKIITNEKYGKLSKFLKIFMGILLLIFAFYFFYLGF